MAVQSQGLVVTLCYKPLRFRHISSRSPLIIFAPDNWFLSLDLTVVPILNLLIRAICLLVSLASHPVALSYISVPSLDFAVVVALGPLAIKVLGLIVVLHCPFPPDSGGLWQRSVGGSLVDHQTELHTAGLPPLEMVSS